MVKTVILCHLRGKSISFLSDHKPFVNLWPLEFVLEENCW